MIYLLINPLSNNKKASDNTENIKKILIKRFVTENKIEVCNILNISPIKNFLSGICASDIIVVAGGDGTISNFANEVYELKLNNKIFYFPCGSGNDFFNDVKNDSEIRDFLIPFNKYISNLPYVKVNGIKKYFINGIGYGIDGYACEEGDKVRAKSNKKVNYTKIALKGVFGGFKPVNAIVTVDGKTSSYKKVWLSPTMIGRFYGGGMMVAPFQNRLNKEKVVTSIVAHSLSIPKIMLIFPGIFKGKHIKFKKNVAMIQGHNVSVEFDISQALQIDGETISNVKSYSVIYE